MPTLNIKPCPHCKVAADVRSLGRGWWVECLNCLMRGPNEPDEHKAIASWNDLPRSN